MAEMIHTDIFLMGGWSSGLPAATGAVKMGADTVLIERECPYGQPMPGRNTRNKFTLAARLTYQITFIAPSYKSIKISGHA